MFSSVVCLSGPVCLLMLMSDVWWIRAGAGRPMGVITGCAGSEATAVTAVESAVGRVHYVQPAVAVIYHSNHTLRPHQRSADFVMFSVSVLFNPVMPTVAISVRDRTKPSFVIF